MDAEVVVNKLVMGCGVTIAAVFLCLVSGCAHDNTPENALEGWQCPDCRHDWMGPVINGGDDNGYGSRHYSSLRSDLQTSKMPTMAERDDAAGQLRMIDANRAGCWPSS